MPDLAKAFRLLGLAQRARKLSCGMSAAQKSLKMGHTHLLLLASDLAENARSKIKATAIEHRVACAECGNKEQLGDLFGRSELGIVGVEDAGFAKSLRQLLPESGTPSPSSAQALKKGLRSSMHQRRDALTPAQIATLSARIVDRLQSLPEFSSARTFHTYVSWKSEVQTHVLIRQLLENDCRVVTPLVDRKRHTLRHVEIRSFADLRPGAYGILEPGAENPDCPVADIGVVLVPGLAFDAKGNRLGYGGGYYDRFLPQVSVPKIVLAFDFQVVEKLPAEADDQPVDRIVTEKRVIECRRQRGAEAFA